METTSNRSPDNFIETDFHKSGCKFSGSPGTRFYGQERTTGGQCAVIFTLCATEDGGCDEMAKHHFSIVGEHPTYNEVLQRLLQLGVNHKNT